MKAGLEGKVAVVTGGAAGIGRAAAVAFAESGAAVVIADLKKGTLRASGPDDRRWRTGGAIVNMASVAGLVGFQSGVRVNAVCPGVIHTEMIDRVTGRDPAIERQFTGLEPMGRMGKPEEIAAAAVWLCSDAASFVTGHPLTIDEGLVAQ